MSVVDESSSLTRNTRKAPKESNGTRADPAYDAAGNMTSGPKAGDESTRLHFVYDDWNRLVKVKSAGGTLVATYAYDGRGYRIRKVIAGGDTTDYYYSENHQVIEERTNGSSTPSNDHVLAFAVRKETV